MICENPNDDCFFLSCGSCPSVDIFKENLLKNLESAFQTEVTYKQWKTVDRFDLFTVTEPIELFVENLVKKLQKLISHDYVSKEQSEFVHKKGIFKIG